MATAPASGGGRHLKSSRSDWIEQALAASDSPPLNQEGGRHTRHRGTGEAADWVPASAQSSETPSPSPCTTPGPENRPPNPIQIRGSTCSYRNLLPSPDSTDQWSVNPGQCGWHRGRLRLQRPVSPSRWPRLPRPRRGASLRSCAQSRPAFRSVRQGMCAHGVRRNSPVHGPESGSTLRTTSRLCPPDSGGGGGGGLCRDGEIKKGQERERAQHRPAHEM